jgi:capsule polysaccharide export protein KpsE/RkpR
MASLKETAEQLAGQLEELVGQLRSELTNGNVDFDKLVSIADELSERADGLAETFTSVNDTLLQRVQQAKGSSSGQSRRSGSQSESSKAGAKS